MADSKIDPALAQDINTAFGPSQTETEARKKKKKENDDAEDTTSAWQTIKSMAGDAASGFKDVATNPVGAWKTINNP